MNPRAWPTSCFTTFTSVQFLLGSRSRLMMVGFPRCLPSWLWHPEPELSNTIISESSEYSDTSVNLRQLETSSIWLKAVLMLVLYGLRSEDLMWYLMCEGFHFGCCWESSQAPRAKFVRSISISPSTMLLETLNSQRLTINNSLRRESWECFMFSLTIFDFRLSFWRVLDNTF